MMDEGLAGGGVALLLSPPAQWVSADVSGE